MRLMPAALSLLLLPSLSYGADFNGAELSLAWGIPFACILLSVALFPIFAPTFWHHHFGKVIAAWTLAFLIPFTVIFGPSLTVGTVAHAMLGEYIPFILLLLALYTVSGGILIWGNLDGSPKLNTTILALGTFLASIMGTTGAAMLLIRPLLKANENRKHKVHVVVFFIFLVANIGGGLTPLGDPPLFLGFLKGVDFMWTVEHMLPPVLMNSAILLVMFFLIDSYFFSKKDERLAPAENAVRSPLKIMGRWNFLLLLAVIASVLMSGIWKPGIEINILGTDVGLQSIVRDVLLLCITLASLKITPKPIRAGNEFNWDPMLEVGKLFLGIFITIAPVIAILQAGEAGHFKSLIAMVHNDQGEPLNIMYFWMSGMLSAFLDNAPTYLVFFNMASGDPVQLMGEMQATLLAVSMGSVFMGALTYIGNAPNFMVKAIAEQRKVKMPTFFGYMLWSFGLLVPLYIIQTFVFFM
ncbi:MAG: sodium:proton antiporter [Neisseriaceae bacterium]|nr:sodium:proton antiporter [Neisseriaceae bacterium]MBP6863214.1 sodium:proton antiporter [Neisseriaceae bacterium]